MTDRPESARWLSPAEKDLAARRVMSERVGTTEILDKLNFRKTMRGMFNPITVSTGFIFLLTNITVQGLGFFTPTIIKTIYPKNSVISQQLHTVPPYVVGTVLTIGIPLLSWRFENRNIFIMLSAPLVIAGYIMFVATTNPQIRYAATFLIASGAFANGALCNAQVSANVISDTAHSSAIGLNVMMGNIGGLIATWSFLPFDGPNYLIGNGLNLATSTTILISAFLLSLWMRYDNKKRAGVDTVVALQGLCQKEIQDLDWRHPEFRWKQ
jgi:predicted MFS family arabinose efflux permease